MITTQQKQRFSGALDRVAGDTELLISIAALVAEDAPEVLVALKSNLVAGNLQEVAAAGHQLKGMLSTFETDGPTIQLQQVIHTAREGDLKEAKAVFSRCEGEIGQLMKEIALLAETPH